MSTSTLRDHHPKVTITSIQEKKLRHEPITCLTAYDYPSAHLIDEAGIDIVLVGDSLAQVVLGYESTLPVTMEEMLHHSKAVRRAVKRALVVADMPYGSYQIDEKEAVRNAARFVKEAGAEAVKLEGGTKRVSLIRRLEDAEIPVMGHIGLTPQSVHRLGGYKVQGKSLPAVERLMKDAVALDHAGIFALVLEAIPRELAQMITSEVQCPTIGIGAGPDCDGQVLVFHDLVNLSFTPPGKFVRQYVDAAALLGQAATIFKADVESRNFPSDAESYHLPQETKATLDGLMARTKTVAR